MAQQFLARGENVHGGNLFAEDHNHAVHGFQQMLAIVEDQERALLCQRLDSEVERGVWIINGDAESTRHSRGDQIGVGERC